MRLSGRIERRIPLAVELHLSRETESNCETVLTRNVSSNGSSIVTARRCQPGEHVQIRRLSTNVWLRARVVYCHPLDRGEFYVGLEFRAGALDGEARPAYADFLSCETA
jgi:hypothetical protein